MKKVELLIPVGNKECLNAAIHNGADAVYLGGKKFGARAYSNNFDDNEMIEAIKLCHLYGVKIYVTVNTIIYNDEIKEVMDYINFLYIHNVDAIIMQDIGLINLVRKTIPDLEIHVSTQAHNHNYEGIKYFSDIGCTRVVFDRESSLEEIVNIDIPVEKEVFVYGALCVCYSGNCLFSALNGGRSANRGMCVGSCRLPYQLMVNNKITDKGFLLSTKDLNTTGNIKEILDNNIDSLKIEGRMKGPEYVSAVTKVYRRLIDDYYKGIDPIITREELIELYKVYNRKFTKGYLFGEDNIINSYTSNHQGVKVGTIVSGTNKRIIIKLSDDIHQEDAIRIDGTQLGMYLNTLYDKNGLLVSSVSKGNLCQIDNKDRILVKDYIGKDVLKTVDNLLNKELLNYKEKKINVTMNFIGHIGSKMELSISDGINDILVTGGVVETAINQGMNEERIKEQLSKLGSTPFILKEIKIDIDNNIFINIKDINEIRREACSKLIESRYGKEKVKQILEVKELARNNTKGKISILVRNEEQLDIALRNNIDIIYVTDEVLYNKYKDNKNIYLRLDRVINKHKEINNERLLCTELGSIIKYNKNNKIRSDYYINAINDYTINTLYNKGCENICLSVELDIDNLRNIRNKAICEVIVYGYLECMIIKNNIFNYNGEDTYLVNSKNEKYKIISDGKYTHIFNKECLDNIKNVSKIYGFGYYRIELLDENKFQVQSIINSLKDMI